MSVCPSAGSLVANSSSECTNEDDVSSLLLTLTEFERFDLVVSGQTSRDDFHGVFALRNSMPTFPAYGERAIT